MNESFEANLQGATSRMAIWSVVLGIVGLISACVLLGLPVAVLGLILGIVALAQIGKPGRPGQGQGFAIAGVVINAITLVVGPLMIVPLMIGIMLPALGAARTTARQMQANTQARGIQQSMLMWAQGQQANPQTGNLPLPDHVWTLVEQSFITAEYLISPLSNNAPPGNFDTLPPDQQRAWVCAHSAFVVVPGLEEDLDRSKIALFGKPNHFDNHGIPVAYNDTHAAWERDVGAIDRQLQAQTGKTMAELIAQSEAYP
ncbi:MAG: DUF4190 domain-containing protein [Phycisphaeraceae bacterium]|nr:DUF4190 domain-containing protein [Phycisphaeraceae bacterium]